LDCAISRVGLNICIASGIAKMGLKRNHHRGAARACASCCFLGLIPYIPENIAVAARMLGMISYLGWNLI